MTVQQRLELAEFITRGKDDLQCFMEFAHGLDVLPSEFGRMQAVEYLADKYTDEKLSDWKRQLQESNARGDDETFRTMTRDGGYGSSFRAKSWYDAEEQATKSGYKVLDWTDFGGENVLVIAE